MPGLEIGDVYIVRDSAELALAALASSEPSALCVSGWPVSSWRGEGNIADEAFSGVCIHFPLMSSPA